MPPRKRPAASAGAPGLTFREVDRATWSDMQLLFESRGGPKHCWCMVWRATPEEARQANGAGRRAAMARRIDAGVPVGLLGYLDGEPVAWCSIAPRETYRPLGGIDDSASGRVWSIACFFIRHDLRGGGVTAQLIRAAVAHARARGATVIEAYPVDPDSPSYRFMGFVSSFAAAGFHEVGRAGIRRHVMRLYLEAERVGRSRRTSG
jgi:GNAT superfamily N-acetyltransferase